ncbi:MAG: nitroreductase family protein [Bacteroidales bacterium]|nr:nitroreductase family protein [Bacteroidales bacterium]MDY4174544.1 nitroreductase family protein [Bacteroidales bacterium]
MNSLAQLISERRSCRKFTDEPISAEDILQLKRAALSSPTSHNCKSWEFVFVQDKETIAALAKCKQVGAAFVSGAKLCVVVFGNKAITDIWLEDASIASSFLLLQAADLGLGATWVQLRARGFEGGPTAKENVAKLLGTPSDDLEPVSIIAIGHPAESHRPYSDDRLPWDKVRDEKF